jgi:hypothetical protein
MEQAGFHIHSPNPVRTAFGNVEIPPFSINGNLIGERNARLNGSFPISRTAGLAISRKRFNHINCYSYLYSHMNTTSFV